MTIFTIVVISIAIVLFVIGVILLKKNIRPILGFILLIFALVMFIGMSMSSSEIERTLTNIVSRK